MKIGDRVREKSTGFIGTIVEASPPTGEPTRFRVQEDEGSEHTKRDPKVGDAPPTSTWNKVETLELLTPHDTAGRQLDTGDDPGAKASDAKPGAAAHR